MRQLKGQLEGVYHRAHDRGGADVAVERQAEQLRKDKLAHKKAALKKRREAEKAKKVGVTGDDDGLSLRLHPGTAHSSLHIGADGFCCLKASKMETYRGTLSHLGSAILLPAKLKMLIVVLNVTCIGHQLQACNGL